MPAYGDNKHRIQLGGKFEQNQKRQLGRLDSSELQNKLGKQKSLTTPILDNQRIS